MKNFRFYMLALVALVSLASCQEELDVPAAEPVIQLAETEVDIPAEGADQRIAYQVENAVEGQSVSVKSDDAWVEDITVTPRTISFSVGRNETDAFRTTTLHVAYEGADTVDVTVSQEQWVVPIVLTIHNTDATSVTFSVETSDDQMTWIGQIVGKEWYESYAGDQAVFEADLAYFSSEANYYGVTLKEYLAGIMIRGSKKNLVYKGLDPLSEYVLYVYGVSEMGERTTSLYTAPITTAEPYAGPITFEFDVKDVDAVMEVTVTPSHDGVDYYWNMTTPEALKEYDENVPAAITKWLEARVTELLEYGDYTSREEFFEDNTTKNEAVSTYEGIVHTDYIFFAFKWDKECQVVGDVAYVEHRTGDVTPSTNKVEVTVSAITQSSFHVETLTTNSDPYFLIAEPASEMSAVDLENDDAVFHYFYDWLGTFYIWSYVSNGNMGGDFKELKADTEYNVVTFGYKSGALTTDVQIQKVRTLALGDPKDCKFTFEVSDLKTTSAFVKVTPSDKGHYYYWDVFPAEYTANMVKQEINRKFNENYYGDMWEFGGAELTLSDDSGYLSYLMPDTSYKLAAVIIDRNSDKLEYLSYVQFSEVFTTPEAKLSNTSVTCGFHEYYNGDEIAQIEPDKFGGMAGYPWIPLKIEIDGDYAEYYYTIYDYIDGLEDASKYPDELLYDQLFEVGWSLSMSQYFRGKWDTPLMIAAMAIDLEGNYTTIYRQKFTLTRSGAAPAINFVNSYGKSETKTATALELPASVKFER